jgi:lipopolysaccharide export system permease protein
MRTLDRYLAAVFTKNFLLAIMALGGIFFFQAVMGQFLEREFSARQILYYRLLELPQILVQMTPPAVLLATVLTLSGLGRTNELIACFSLGVGLQRIMMMVASLVFIICCMVLILEDRILPPTYRKRTVYYWRDMKRRPDFFLDIKQDKIWYRSRNLIYNLQRFDPKSKTIHGMAVYQFDDAFNLTQLVEADSAEFRPNGWELRDGTVTQFLAEDPFPRTQPFAAKELLIAETPTDFQEIEKEVDGLRLRELWRYIGRMREAGADTKAYEVKFHSRISLSFIPLVMCALGVPFSGRNRRQGGAAKDFGLCLGVTFFYWLFYSVGLSLGTNGALPPWLAAWLPSSIFVALAATLIARRNA